MELIDIIKKARNSIIESEEFKKSKSQTDVSANEREMMLVR